MPQFKLVSPYEAAGDQPQAIEKLVQGVQWGLREQALLGVTGSGKLSSGCSARLWCWLTTKLWLRSCVRNSRNFFRKTRWSIL